MGVVEVGYELSLQIVSKQMLFNTVSLVNNCFYNMCYRKSVLNNLMLIILSY